jgi:hypothetical protein
MMFRALRRAGIAVGSLVAAWAAVSLVAGVFFGTSAFGNVLVTMVTLLLGGLVYRDIIRREPGPV